MRDSRSAALLRRIQLALVSFYDRQLQLEVISWSFLLLNRLGCR
jgi:hypothetical protein